MTDAKMRNDNWHSISWKVFYDKIAKLQQELVMAYRINDNSGSIDSRERLYPQWKLDL